MAAQFSVTSRDYIKSANRLINLWIEDECKDNIVVKIPSVLRKLIKEYLPNYQIYGIGCNYNGFFGCVEKHLPKFQLLPELSRICDNPFTGLLFGDCSLLVYNRTYDCLMIAGNNLHGRCGINSNKEIINIFMNVNKFVLPIEKTNNFIRANLEACSNSDYSDSDCADWITLKYIIARKYFYSNILVDNQNQRLFASGWSIKDINDYYNGGSIPNEQSDIFIEIRTNLFSLSLFNNNHFQQKAKVQQMVFLNSGILVCLMNTGKVYCTHEFTVKGNINNSTNNNSESNTDSFLSFTPFFTSTEYRNKHFLKMVAGQNHLLWMDHNRQLFVSGTNQYGQLGLSYFQCVEYLENDGMTVMIYDDDENVVQFDLDDDHMIREVESAAIDASFQIKLNPFFNDIQDIDCGSSHSAVLLSNGALYLFGYNHMGQIGNGSIDDMMGRQPVCTPFLFQSLAEFHHLRVKQISLGMQHTCILTEDNALYVCGLNLYQQICEEQEVSCIRYPRLVTNEEVGISHQAKIVRVVACNYNTLIVVQDKYL